jgi:peptidoglycan biosynthesis protein MviN/MurJ (putative lipid II flippase)
MQTSLSYRGLALASSIAALIEAAVLLRLISQRLPGLRIGRLMTPALRTLAASLVMGLPTAWLARELEPLVQPYGSAGAALLLGICIVCGAALYVLVSLAFRSDELYALRRLIRR